jgi:hypothetical protein
MHLNEAIVVCDFCWREVRKQQVYSPTAEKRVKVVFEMCPSCRASFGSDYDEFAVSFAIASFLLWQNIPEKILMRDFGQYAENLLTRIRELDSHDLEDIVNKYRQDLIKLKELASKVNAVFETHRARFPLPVILQFVQERDNPFIQYKNYVHKKIKEKAHSPKH